jgi:hypothetical protein
MSMLQRSDCEAAGPDMAAIDVQMAQLCMFSCALHTPVCRFRDAGLSGLKCRKQTFPSGCKAVVTLCIALSDRAAGMNSVACVQRNFLNVVTEMLFVCCTL